MGDEDILENIYISFFKVVRRSPNYLTEFPTPYLTNLNLLYVAFVLPLLQRVRVVEVPLIRIRGIVGFIVILLLALSQLTVPPLFGSETTRLWIRIRSFNWLG